MVTAGVAVMDERGEAGFSLRRVAAVVGCDPMSLTYHFGSKDGLLRAMAHRLDAEVRPGPADVAWRERLRHVAREYRRVALEHPRTFPLLQRFTSSGPADHAHTEVVHRALAEAGVPEDALPTVCVGWYACVIGLAVAEVSGLVAPIGTAEADEILALPADDYALARRLVPGYRTLVPAQVADQALDALVEGIASRWSTIG